MDGHSPERFNLVEFTPPPPGLEQVVVTLHVVSFAAKEATEMRRLTVSILENEVRHIRRVELEHGHAMYRSIVRLLRSIVT